MFRPFAPDSSARPAAARPEATGVPPRMRVVSAAVAWPRDQRTTRSPDHRDRSGPAAWSRLTTVRPSGLALEQERCS